MTPTEIKQYEYDNRESLFFGAYLEVVEFSLRFGARRRGRCFVDFLDRWSPVFKDYVIEYPLDGGLERAK